MSGDYDFLCNIYIYIYLYLYPVCVKHERKGAGMYISYSQLRAYKLL